MVDFYYFEKLEKYDKCRHAVTIKNSTDPYKGSLALHTGEDKKSIIANRTKVSASLSLEHSFSFVVANQIHSDSIKVIKEKKTLGWESMDDAIIDCDALITDIKGVMLTVLTADCVPILLFDKEKEVVGTVHAGWKGTASGIVAKTVKKMTEFFGTDPQHIVAGIAPSIGDCCYMVGEDVAKHFFDTPKFLTVVGKKYMLDLPNINKKQLLDAGLLESNIEMSGICTACEVERFFSYRKEQGCSGRFMSMIGLIPEYT